MIWRTIFFQSSQCQLGKTLDTPFYGDLRLGKVILEFYLEQEFWYRQAGQIRQLSPGKTLGNSTRFRQMANEQISSTLNENSGTAKPVKNIS